MPSRLYVYQTMILTYMAYSVIIIIGHLKDQFGKIFTPWRYKMFYDTDGFPPLYTTFESFFIRRIYRRIADCWNRPVVGFPGKVTYIQERISEDHNSTFNITGNILRTLNFGSYNYLGFGNRNDRIKRAVLEAVDKHDLNHPYPSIDNGPYPLVRELEREMADFIGTEDCIVHSMGFGTNTWTLSALLTDALVFSDVYNHTSLITGIKLTNANVVIFNHNDMRDLENKLIYSISQGQPETHRSWKKIFVLVEGIFSMEGTMAKLPELIELKRKYKFYLYIDEAHSCGAIGKTGRGICEHFQVDPKEVDILMGTFSKSFSSHGGYIAASKDLINYLRARSDGSLYAEQLPPLSCVQILECLRSIKEHPNKVTRLRKSTLYMRKKLKKLKFQIIGDEYSPVIPILICIPGKLGEFSRLALDMGLSVVVVGYPATPVILSRVRLCLSASHTKRDMKRALWVINHIGTVMGMKI